MMVSLILLLHFFVVILNSEEVFSGMLFSYLSLSLSHTHTHTLSLSLTLLSVVAMVEVVVVQLKDLVLHRQSYKSFILLDVSSILLRLS